ncbi:MAG: type II toxin-antitoxin system YafQ family toxin [bacterium]|nr:type II toxin-antitoxin system YafQ family toxin [bacterium]MDA1293070.1 type II toxin-antitoxin system YafQ family toxin [bacterium]
MYQLERTKGFNRDVKKFLASGGNVAKLQRALEYIETGKPLPARFRDHQLKGKLGHCRELHVDSDWLLVYEKDGKKLRVVCLWLLSHKKLQQRERSL